MLAVQKISNELYFNSNIVRVRLYWIYIENERTLVFAHFLAVLDTITKPVGWSDLTFTEHNNLIRKTLR